MNWLQKLERKFGKYAIHNLMTYVIILNIAGFILMTAQPQIYYQYLQLSVEAVLQGQVWRLVTFLLEPPAGRILILLCIDATTCCSLSASTVDMENKSTKKHKSRFIRSEKVDIHAGEPFGGSSGLFFATIPHLRPVRLPLPLWRPVTGRISTFPQSLWDSLQPGLTEVPQWQSAD